MCDMLCMSHFLIIISLIASLVTTTTTTITLRGFTLSQSVIVPEAINYELCALHSHPSASITTIIIIIIVTM